jgi:hypothetical protein
MRPTFNQTVNVLVQAYLNDTLEHCNGCACAIGNLVAHANNYTFIPAPPEYSCSIVWNEAEYPSRSGWLDARFPNPTEIALEQISSIGYTIKEVFTIERAFELPYISPSHYREHKDEVMFEGLMNVVDVLAEIHEVSLEHKEEAKLLFV